ncbi:ATP-binding cassette domain-containing protein [Streptomyces tsukubensis]|uniref:ABC transporter domain-containing protein n=1 Tax=Streptomyces tsukubensis TaxID=83656 RepID=A0A1V4A7Y0_9ACTN|nr:ATP-binding cassette domain-containing protein [Streptomyces tsukubensis]OON78743.1 hypothetical protein B1H18_15240 [Streptomyces tsukubensis]
MPFLFDACSFRYSRRIPVLEQLNLKLRPGCSALLGPGGAGKSTVLGLAAAALVPRSGSVRYRGLDACEERDRHRYRQSVGLLPQESRPIPGLTVREQVSYAGGLKGMTRADAWERAEWALDRVGLRGLRDRRSHLLSRAQLRRVGVAEVLVHDADVILMDEPMAGLDAEPAAQFRSLMGDLGSELSVVVSAARIDDLDGVNGALYDEVVVLDQGTLRYQGPAKGAAKFLPPVTEARRTLCG